MARLSKENTLKRGEIWVADLRPTIGWEVAKKRPALIISNNQINSISPVVVAIPLSSQIPNVLGPERVLLKMKESGLDKASVVFITQMRAIDKSRIIKKIGKISKQKLLEVEEAVKLVLGLDEID